MLNGSSLGPFLRENQPKYMWKNLVKEHELSIVPKKINHEHPILKWLEFWKNEPQTRKEMFPIYKERKKKGGGLADFLLLFVRTIFLFSDG